MEKETLTIENIKKDLKKAVLIQSIGKAWSLLWYPFIYLPLRALIIIKFDPSSSFKTIFTVVFFAIFGGLLLYDVITAVICLIQIKKESFTITLDHVIEKKDKRIGTRYTVAKPYRFVFAKSGTYSLPYGRLYSWSNCFSTTAITLFEYTEINEEFYVIRTSVQKNIIAYRTKHFELKENKELL